MRTLIVALALGISLSSAVNAGEHDHSHHYGEERIDHYASEKPVSKAQAMALLSKRITMIENILNKNALESNDLELIHEASYDLEAAVDYLKEQPSADSALFTKLDDAVDDVHHASEDHKMSELRDAFKVLKSQVKPLQ